MGAHNRPDVLTDCIHMVILLKTHAHRLLVTLAVLLVVTAALIRWSVSDYKGNDF